METISKNKMFGGTQFVLSHKSKATSSKMEFAVFVPKNCEIGKNPALVYLSGLTCNWENVTVKAGAQQYCANNDIIFICPDTSPKSYEGLDIPNDDGYDFGQGAGFYVNATVEPWAKNFQMSDYITKDLLSVIKDNFAVDMDKIGITGHSMGGHGALTIGLKNPDLFKSISAFSPIVSPINCPWGQKALAGYLGDNQDNWLKYDACELIKSKGWNKPILVDQGLDDNFLETELKSELLKDACKESEVKLELNYREGYDHSYYFIASFIENHIKFHVKQLG